MSDSVQPHRWQLTRLPRPWDSPGKNTGLGCHSRESEVAQLCPTLSNPMDCSLLGSSVHGIFQARELEWGAIAFSISAGRRYQRQLLCIYGLICSKQRLHNLTHLCFGKTTLIILKKDKSKRRNTGFE